MNIGDGLLRELIMKDVVTEYKYKSIMFLNTLLILANSQHPFL